MDNCRSTNSGWLFINKLGLPFSSTLEKFRQHNDSLLVKRTIFYLAVFINHSYIDIGFIFMLCDIYHRRPVILHNYFNLIQYFTIWCLVKSHVYFHIRLYQDFQALWANKKAPQSPKMDYWFCTIVIPALIISTINYHVVAAIDLSLMDSYDVVQDFLPIWSNINLHGFNVVLNLTELYLRDICMPSWKQVVSETNKLLSTYALLCFFVWIFTGGIPYPFFIKLKLVYLICYYGMNVFIGCFGFVLSKIFSKSVWKTNGEKVNNN